MRDDTIAEQLLYANILSALSIELILHDFEVETSDQYIWDRITDKMIEIVNHDRVHHSSFLFNYSELQDLDERHNKNFVVQFSIFTFFFLWLDIDLLQKFFW